MLSVCPPLQGVRTGSYGPHGMEVLQLAVSSCEADVPPGCPIRGPRLQGLKLLGDPNVPALKCVLGSGPGYVCVGSCTALVGLRDALRCMGPVHERTSMFVLARCSPQVQLCCGRHQLPHGALRPGHR